MLPYTDWSVIDTFLGLIGLVVLVIILIAVCLAASAASRSARAGEAMLRQMKRLMLIQYGENPADVKRDVEVQEEEYRKIKRTWQNIVGIGFVIIAFLILIVALAQSC